MMAWWAPGQFSGSPTHLLRLVARRLHCCVLSYFSLVFAMEHKLTNPNNKSQVIWWPGGHLASICCCRHHRQHCCQLSASSSYCHHHHHCCQLSSLSALLPVVIIVSIVASCHQCQNGFDAIHWIVSRLDRTLFANGNHSLAIQQPQTFDITMHHLGLVVQPSS